MSAIVTRGLAKAYRTGLRRRRHRALADVDLEVPRGTAFGLIGLNGAGKTTFIKSLLGVVRPDAGEVTVLGGDPEDPAIRRRIGYLPERLLLRDAYTPRVFLRTVAAYKALPGAVAEVARQLDRVGLTADADRRVGGFSKGMRQRLGVAAALLGAPDLLVLDEPTDGVDPLGRIAIRGILRAERDRGATIFLNSHLLSETERICDRVAILNAGRVVTETTLEALAVGAGWRARFADGADGAALEVAGFERGEAAAPAGWRFPVDDPEALNAALDRARAAGARLVELAPDVPDLETLLARAVHP